MRPMNNVCLYARVSTKNNGQNPESQLLPLRDYAKARGLVIVEEFIDHGHSGAKERRPRLDALMTAARAGKFDGVLVWRFDRFARSVRHLATALDEFSALGIHFVSLTEAIDTSTPMGKMIYAITGAFAEFERNITQERIMAGLQRAKKQGKQLGRPRVVVDREKVRRLQKDGLTLRAIASKLQLSKSTIHNILSA